MPVFVSASLIRLEDADGADRMALTAEAEGAHPDAMRYLRAYANRLRNAAALDARVIDDDATPVRKVMFDDSDPTDVGFGRRRS